MADDELDEQLRRLGDDPGPAVDVRFADRLETDLRYAWAEGAAGAPVGGGFGRAWLRMGVLGLLVVAVVAGGWALVRDGDSTERLVMSAAQNTDVRLPPDRATTGVAGLELPNGARIDVRDGGSAVVDGVVLDEGEGAVVVDGTLEVLPTSVPPSDPPPPTDDPDGTPPPPFSTVAPTTSNGTPTSTTPPVSTDPPPTSTVEPSDVPSTTSPPSSTTRPTVTLAPTSTKPDVTTTTVPTTTVGPIDVGPIMVTLRVSADGDRAALLWEARPSDAIRRWRVLATTDDSSRVLAVLRDPTARRLTVEPSKTAAVSYRVMALGEGGGVLAESNVVVLEPAAVR